MKRKLVVQSGEQLDTWGTPPEVIEFVRAAFGRKEVVVDLASNAEANKVIRARRYYSIKDPCPDAVPQLRMGQLVWCNPPGPVEEVRRFWNIWRRAIRCTAYGAFLIFNLDHWRTLDVPDIEEQFSVCIWPKRLRFVGAPHQYNHPSAVVLSGDYALGEVRRTMNIVRWSR